MGSTKRKSRRVKTETFLVRLRKELGIETFADLTRNTIKRTLALVKGDKVLTAALLGIGKSTLYRRVDEQL